MPGTRPSGGVNARAAVKSWRGNTVELKIRGLARGGRMGDMIGQPTRPDKPWLIMDLVLVWVALRFMTESAMLTHLTTKVRRAGSVQL